MDIQRRMSLLSFVLLFNFLRRSFQYGFWLSGASYPLDLSLAPTFLNFNIKLSIISESSQHTLVQSAICLWMKHKHTLLDERVSNQDQPLSSMLDSLKYITLVQQVRIINYHSIPDDVELPVNDRARKLLERDEKDLSLLNQFTLHVINLFGSFTLLL